MNLRNARLVLAFLLLMVAEPFIGPHSSSFIRVASGQGLSVSADNLGAGAEATANEFEQFESALELATTGGRGRWVSHIALLAQSDSSSSSSSSGSSNSSRRRCSHLMQLHHSRYDQHQQHQIPVCTVLLTCTEHLQTCPLTYCCAMLRLVLCFCFASQGCQGRHHQPWRLRQSQVVRNNADSHVLHSRFASGVRQQQLQAYARAAQLCWAPQ
jgi:hypothetical protein